MATEKKIVAEILKRRSAAPAMRQKAKAEPESAGRKIATILPGDAA
jgi:hypothetical protein